MKIIDLSQPISMDTQVMPAFPKPLSLRHIDHNPKDKFSSQSRILIMTDHTATHIDAFCHFDANPEADDISEMPLDLFFGEAICLDISSFPVRRYITANELKDVVAKSALKINKGDIVLFYSGHYAKNKGTPDFITEFSALGADCVRWMKKKGVKLFGVESLSPDNPLVDDSFPNHRACKEVHLTHIECLCNMEELINKRFKFFGFPLKIINGTASPIRAVAIID